MEAVELKDLDPRIIKQVEDLRKKLDRNPAHAAGILEGIVRRNPGCLEVRQLLRQAQNKASAKKASQVTKLLMPLTNMSLTMGVDKKIEKDPSAVMDAAEKAITANPQNTTAHAVLGKAALAAGLIDTAIFAFESFRAINPKDSTNAKALMNAYIENHQTEEAIKVGDATLRLNPADDEVANLIKKASVQQSISKGKWDEEKDFRSKLKDEEQSVKLEQASRARTDEEGMRSLIADALAAIEKEPEDLNSYRDAATNYRKLGEFDKALEMLGRARQTASGKADTTLERLVFQIEREKMAAAIATKEAALEQDPENASLKSELEDLRKEELAFRLEQAKGLVQRYPNEFGYRYELGELYLAQGQLDDAIKEFQLAQRNPKVRVNALVYLGKAYKQKGFYDLAAEQLETAKKEIPLVNDQKKDVVYELGSCYEQQGDMEKAISEYKALYGMDIAFRDVAQKIDAFYSSKR
jgi:tetratricopeptide (TPR) repeat protein